MVEKIYKYNSKTAFKKYIACTLGRQIKLLNLFIETATHAEANFLCSICHVEAPMGMKGECNTVELDRSCTDKSMEKVETVVEDDELVLRRFYSEEKSNFNWGSRAFHYPQLQGQSLKLFKEVAEIWGEDSECDRSIKQVIKNRN
ncbi:hypothetical protein HELRODRAFT_183790 [Helobdella robusta]|uniref:Uncharacterized protein n=1 Tax=Helobdella robusta TaxID=6412 RepID=T1FK70_HELRO|nr:hypothetical protein HELRODRAFT_183790 [Helobdella robusta]ESO10265.1 hypothetical protein HELRODRAFT_183790 [Helobdella robusta]